VRLTDDLGSVVRHDADAAQGEVDVTEWKSGDVREASLVRVDDLPPFALDRVGAGLVERLAGSDVAFDLPQRQVAERDARAHGEPPSRAAGGDERDFGAHQVFAAGQGRQHRDRVGPVRRFSDTLAIEQDLRVRGERHLAGSSGRVGFRARRRSEPCLVDVRRRRFERDLQQPQEIDAAWRGRRETEHLPRVGRCLDDTP
jgi:hypothetical protein